MPKLEVRPYWIAQASWAGSLPMCGALASLSARPGWAFLLLAGNAFAHLLLDALETKWGNGDRAARRASTGSGSGYAATDRAGSTRSAARCSTPPGHFPSARRSFPRGAASWIHTRSC